MELAPQHRKLYDTHLQRERQKLLGLIEDMDKNRFIVFRSLTLLRMLSLDASLVDEEYADRAVQQARRRCSSSSRTSSPRVTGC